MYCYTKVNIDNRSKNKNFGYSIENCYISWSLGNTENLTALQNLFLSLSYSAILQYEIWSISVKWLESLHY